jgi:WD repeat-containing protein 23
LLPSDRYPSISRQYSWWGGFLRDFTCVRDVSWHPTAPVFAATGFQGCGVGRGFISVHSWEGADADLKKDEKANYKPKIYSTEMMELN